MKDLDRKIYNEIVELRKNLDKIKNQKDYHDTDARDLAELEGRIYMANKIRSMIQEVV